MVSGGPGQCVNNENVYETLIKNANVHETFVKNANVHETLVNSANVHETLVDKANVNVIQVKYARVSGCIRVVFLTKRFVYIILPSFLRAKSTGSILMSKNTNEFHF